ncbi:MAG: hypothetical protein HXS50_02035 [Theionarchaea archaeon]|nr:hypothetical protein [Theionarchaea archaeon]
MKHGFTAIVLVLVISLACLSGASGREERRDPATGRIRILYIGDPVPGSPHPIFLRDPITDVVPIIASGFNFPTSIIRRYMRLYMPRTPKGLYENFDVIIISDAGIRFFTDQQLNSFRDGVVDQGMALIMIGGFEAFGGNIGLGSWGPTPIQEVLPVDSLENEWEDKAGKLTVVENEDPLMKSLPFDEIGGYGIFYGCNIVANKQGSQTLANYQVVGAGRRHTLLSYWEIGKGSSFAMTADWTPAGGVDFLRWQYYGDYALNVMTYIIGGKLPEDPALVYQTRQLMSDFRNIRQTLDALIEFASKFGANMAAAEELIGEAEDAKRRAERSYIDAEIEDSIEEMKAAILVLEEASDKAYRLKDEALFWVYVTEWLVVASTGLICGFILWTFMVRRKMYREIGQTRLSRLDRD